MKLKRILYRENDPIKNFRYNLAHVSSGLASQ